MGKHTRRRTSPLRTILSATASLTLALVLAVFGAGGTYALWSSTAVASPTVTMTAGNAALAVGTLALPTTALYPGLTVYAPVTVQNTGTVPLTVRVAGLVPPTTSTALSQNLTVGVAAAASAGACTAGVAPTWTGTFAGAVPAALATPTLAPGASVVLCASLSLSVAAPAAAQGQSAGFGIMLDGLQA